MSRDKWWFDYVEGEVDAQTRAEMKSVLRNSSKDQELVKSLSDTKTMIKESAEPEIEMSDDFFDALHDKIMAKVEETEIKPKPQFHLRPEHKRQIKNITMGFGLVLSLLAVFKFVTYQTPNPQNEFTHQLVENSQGHGDELSRMMTYQDSTDFFVDVASESLDHLTKEQFEKLFETTNGR